MMRNHQMSGNAEGWNLPPGFSIIKNGHGIYRLTVPQGTEVAVSGAHKQDAHLVVMLDSHNGYKVLVPCPAVVSVQGIPNMELDINGWRAYAYHAPKGYTVELVRYIESP